MNDKIITFNARAFLNISHIDYVEEGQKTTKNRLNIHCPFCTGSRKYHLGIHKTDGYANCWRCGPHSIMKVVKAVLHVSWSEVYAILDEFKDVSAVPIDRKIKARSIENVVLPGVLEPLKEVHRKYLQNKRNFDPDVIIDTWQVQSVGPVGQCKHRIFIPIIHRGQIVSYQCRSIASGDDVIRYITCSPNNEKIFHKDILYGLDYAVSDTAVVVEGVTDVWRMGPGALGTFGINYMKEQVYQLSKYKHIYLLFDPEKTAQRQAEKLATELAFRKTCTPFILDIKDTGVDDPGTLPQKEAEELMSEILTGRLAGTV